MRQWVVAIGALMTGACALLIDTNDFVGPATNDAGPAESDASASGPADARADVSPATLCTDAPDILFCETFDGPGDPVKSYSGELDVPTTFRVLDTKTFFTPPGAARFEILKQDNNESPDTNIRISVNQVAEHFSFEGQVYIEREEPNKPARLLQVFTEGESGIHLEPSGLVADGEQTITQIGKLALGRWHAIKVEIKVGSPALVKLTVNDQTTEELKAGPLSKSAPGAVFGISEAASPTTGWVVYWDNIVLRSL